MTEVVSIHRGKDLAYARRLVERVRRQKGFPATLVVPESLVARLADRVGDFREQRRVALADAEAKIEAEAATAWGELRLLKAHVKAVRAAWQNFHTARMALGAMLDAALGVVESGKVK